MSTVDERRARVIARACYQHAAKRTGDIATMRAAAIELNTTYDTERQPSTTDQEGTDQ
ncbi:hypothetical protein BX265_2323 [Streptomyces sp. TLI_235]|nr:hypothetical protein [Streptomyces sp. TLI_235]PBC77572.1 hypothetical protein BX265_2323 [Streptomyces sp. TLI_235]